MANMIAVHAARRAAMGNKDLPNATLYVSEQSHYCIAQAARFVGLQPKHVKHLPSLADRTVDVEALRRELRADVEAGLTPIAVCATAGTTNTGAVDNIAGCADACAEFGDVWLHVDAAYGGAFALTGRGKELMRGMERADSVVVDPHKGLFVPYGLGALLVKDRAKLLRANHEVSVRGAQKKIFESSRRTHRTARACTRPRSSRARARNPWWTS
jgi:aromatic-L-amino-acid decarboxylase